MKLHENKTLFNQAVRFTAQKLGILDIYVEKDYWVAFALKIIFSSKAADYTIFKGGTALSKCYGMIERFSEDIDLVVIRSDESNSQLKNKTKKISKILDPYFPEIEVDGITQKMGMNRKTAHSYSKIFSGEFGQVRDSIIIEASWLGYFEPNEEKEIKTLIAEMMEENNQTHLISEYGLEPFKVSVLKPTRTLCEKIMSLVRFSYSEDAISDLKNIEFLLTSLDEQNAIVNALKDMDTEIAALENRRKKTLAMKQGMMQELLTGRIRLVQGGAA